MLPFSFTIPGEPAGKARARTFFDHRVNHVVSKTPGKTVAYETLVRICYQKATNGHYFPDDTPLCVGIKAYFGMAKRTPKSKIGLMLVGRIRPIKKPDLDNISKIILDALNKTAYKDDAAIVLLVAQKYYSNDPRVEVTIGEWEAPKE